MTQGFVAVFFLLFVAPFAACPQQSTQWQSLFDGKSTRGWASAGNDPDKAFPTASWTIHDGWLHALPNPNGSIQDIRTQATFRSFELEWEWRCGPAGNSGVKYLLLAYDSAGKGGPANVRARGLEYQLGGEHGDAKASRDPRYLPGALYGVFAPPPESAPIDSSRIHNSRLIVRGQQVEHWLDGRKVAAFSLTAPELATISRRRPFPASTAWDSPIVLQHHRQAFWFRNLRIRRLD